MLVKGMRLLTPRGSFTEAQQHQQHQQDERYHHQQQQQQQQQHQPLPLQQHERLADSVLARRIVDSDTNASFLDFSSTSLARPPSHRRVAWADHQQTSAHAPQEQIAAPSPLPTPNMAAAIGMIVVPLDDYSPGSLVVSDIVLHSPAAAAGIVPGDEITHVDGHRVFASEEVASRVAGPEGSCVQISGIRDGRIATFSVIRRAMWLDVPPPQPTSLPPAPPPPPHSYSHTNDSTTPHSDNESTVTALKASLHEACIAWQEDVRKIHRHYEALLIPLCESVHVDPLSAAVTAVDGCSDLASLADLLKVTRMAQIAACGADDEFVAKYLAIADSPAPAFAWQTFCGASNVLDATSEDVQRALKIMNQKLMASQRECSLLQSKCDTIPALQTALESEKAEVQRLDAVIAKFRSAVSHLRTFAHSSFCDRSITGVERTRTFSFSAGFV
jgi:hypothetical protein